MAQVQLDVPYNEGPRNRGTVAIRLILAIPHLMIVQVWDYAVEIVAIIQWFIQVFTGKRNEGLFNFSNRWLGYASPRLHVHRAAVRRVPGVHRRQRQDAGAVQPRLRRSRSTA